ncbi:MFS transporter [Rhodococcus sp. KBS0724]|uniref:MFS transporter n=1 Tax=Rhodococcus sp. KBS0724 TaxID=1179674 RepID=UPI00110EDEC3|nr:MFS transporter [Rhodococcus sp. KBS0724]TSD49586.1 MFS transporter [Rhodococcus sp. KBS0724]
MTAVVDGIRGLQARTFASLSNPNFRLFMSGQSVSLTGNWMQTIAQSWLVLELTGSATAIGIVLALQTVPMLLLGPYGGVIADRFDRRTLMIGLQVTLGLLALVLGVLVVADVIALWHVYVIAGLFGLVQCFENPARQAFVAELVGHGDLRNAVSLNSTVGSVARAVGPALAGVTIAAGGLGICFLFNAVGYGAVVLSLVRLDVSALVAAPGAARVKRQMRDGLAYVRSETKLLAPLLMMALVGCLTYEFHVVFPIVATQTFGADAQMYGLMTAAMAIGAVGGGLLMAAWGRTGVMPLLASCTVFGLALVAAAASPTLWILLAVLVAVGMCSVSFAVTVSSSLQLEADPAMRGRVMSLWSAAFIGSSAVGAPIAGWVCQEWGGRAGLLLGAFTCFAATALGSVLFVRNRATAARVS